MTNFIRNFSIIAHIDHGKSTLADRFLQRTQTVDERKFQDQLLDSMDLERERGITIKSHPVSIRYTPKGGREYVLNLIDTPGHVDFSYEVSRSLAACEGALLLIDAAQGVQAQTVANVNLAMRQNLTIIPVINKIDLPAADIEMCYEQLEEILAIPADEAILASAKEGVGIDEILAAITTRIPPPKPSKDAVIQALIFDSEYDSYRGVINYVRMVCGTVKKGTMIRFFSSGLVSEVKEVGEFSPGMKAIEELSVGSVGYLIANIKSPEQSKIGDTITGSINRCAEPLPGFRTVKPMVFSGIYPIDTAEYETLKQNMAKLRLNDAAFIFQPETSAALGFGFRCGFLGLLHMEIIQERLRREYGMDIIATYPNVVYHVYKKSGEKFEIDNPLQLPDQSSIERIEEPMVNANIIAPTEYIGVIMNLIMDKRGICHETNTVDHNHVMMKAVLPLHEIVIDFYDKLKSSTKGYGSMDYEPSEYSPAPLVKLEIHVNGEPVDAFTTIVHQDYAHVKGRQLAERLKELLPRHLFKIPIQAVVGGKIVARETVSALRKDVTAKCYGGDITRKRKLLEKQKEGKKKMKQIGKVNIPQDAFIKVLKSTQT